MVRKTQKKQRSRLQNNSMGGKATQHRATVVQDQVEIRLKKRRKIASKRRKTL